MGLKMAIVVGLVVIAMAMSGCCCCSFPTDNSNPGTYLPTGSSPSDYSQDTSTSTGGAVDLIGSWSWSESASYVYSSTGTYAGYSGLGATVVFNENGTFTFAGVFPNIAGSSPGYVFMGRYHVNGDTIRYTNIIKYYYPDMSKVQHTTENIADTSGTYRIEPGDSYDTIYLQADGLWDNETALYRYKSD
jgi:hypothetical protein